MISKTQIKFLKKLQQKKFRKLHNCFLIEGKKIVFDALSSNFTIRTIYVTDEFLSKNNDVKFPDNLAIETISSKDILQISSLQTPEGILALVEIPKTSTDFSEGPLLLLDQLQDPGNLGTIIRTADWFGFTAIVCSENTVDIYNPKTIQAAKGSLFHTPVITTNLGDFIKKNNDFTFYGTALSGIPINNTKFKKDKTALIIGNEANGISQEIFSLCNYKLTIPGNGQAESLNAAIAAAICCYEISCND